MILRRYYFSLPNTLFVLKKKKTLYVSDVLQNRNSTIARDTYTCDGGGGYNVTVGGTMHAEAAMTGLPAGAPLADTILP